jgi:uncharacterized pyridoxamine 5'-phosphate oxidase family protein
MDKKIVELLKSREFVSVAAADPEGKPYAAPKFILKVESNFIYLVDYVIARIHGILKVNPNISISLMDNNSLKGYQVNGAVEIIEKGPEFDLLVKALAQKEMELSSRRIVEGVTRGKAHEGFELAMAEKFVIFKVRVEEIVEIFSSGLLKREKVCE